MVDAVDLAWNLTRERLTIEPASLLLQEGDLLAGLSAPVIFIS